MIRKISVIIAVISLAALSGCGGKDGAKDAAPAESFHVETINRYTPVKSQGKASDCWAYAMISTIESNHIEMGDSVHLSVAYVLRHRLKDLAAEYYLTGGKRKIDDRGTAVTLLRTILTHGIVPYDAYQDDATLNSGVLVRKLTKLAGTGMTRRTGLENLYKKVDDLLDDELGPAPRFAFMLGAEYTALEFAHSVCAPDEYQPLTSFTHHPFGAPFALEVEDNREGEMFMNVPLDTLERRVVDALNHHRSVCWEGDISEDGFSFDRGIARVSVGMKERRARVTQEERQKAFESFRTTDDHCMSIIGIARDDDGNKYFICKNSWGTKNPYRGLMYMSFDYFRLKTIAVVI